jgi:uracil-DNA glycosylase
MQPRIHESWQAVLGDEFEQPYMSELRGFLVAEVEAGRRFYPPADKVFNALSLTPFEAVRVVILGQDPYHGPGQAMGLCFSVPDGIAPPPSLQNIFKELSSDLGVQTPSHGDLTSWAERGVLLLNAVLTVSPRKPGSHAGKGWERFTDRAVAELSDRREGVVFLLWGKYAQQKGDVVDGARHHVLTAAHPSPYSATGFFGCRHFSRANELLVAAGEAPIDWQLP